MMVKKILRIVFYIFSIFFFLGFLVAFFSGYKLTGFLYFLIAFLINPLPFSFMAKILSNKVAYTSINALRFIVLYCLIYFNMVQNQVETGDKVRQTYSSQISGYILPPSKNKTP